MKQFRLVDNLMGWITFAIAAFVYCSTVEPTASFWDCPEFITTAYKLEVGHPPGAPFFMLTGNLFTQFVSDPTKVALMVNIMSALFSAACIMFLFWSISHLTRKLVGTNGQISTLGQLITVEASALTGALIYTFSDTFWYSAVEGEVYAYSSLFTAVVFWLMLKWEDHADEPHSDRWLIFIAYLTGLSIGVHLLNLLCLPALVLVYYFRRYPNANARGSLIALAGSFALVAAVLYGIVPGIVKVGGWFELLFVNTLGLPFNTGMIVYMILLVGIVLWSIWETTVQRNRLRMNLSYLFSVGMLGIPFYSHGLTSVFVGILVLALLYFVLNRQVNKTHWISARLMNTSLLCMLMIMIGYSSYAVIVIRSSANTPMDQNSPEDIFTLGSYLSREQYGDRPLFYGQQYTSQVKYKSDGQYCTPVSKQGAPVYQRKEKASPEEKDRYIIQRYDIDYVYAQNVLFPRMYSERHAADYESWLGGVKGNTVPYDRCGELVQVKVPTMFENIRFFLSYQVNFMYWRYFMWNFAGRQNDVQGHGEWEHGNWITGIPFLDNLRLGDQSKLPTELRENKGRNVFYCLPLILGLIGLFWQLFRNTKENRGEGEKQFWVVFFLFFMTGLAIVIYLNQTPVQPRERDYAYAGSFYAFAIWCGMGVAGVAEALRRVLRNENLCAGLSCLCVLVPIQMAGQTWDDHDRSGRYTCRDFGQNYLQSLDEGKNPIVFTNGDNDTFPLWYCQETEGMRTDARVCNLSYLQTDWYIDQMKRPAYDSPAVPIHWSRLQYVEGTREGVAVRPGMLEQVINYYKDDPAAMREALGDNPYELRNIIDKWVLNDNPELQIIPTDSIVFAVDKEAVRRSGMMLAGDSIPDFMHISLKGKRAVYKSEMMMYEMLAQCNWERPLYVATTVGPDNYGSLGNYFVQEGLVNRITPFNTKANGQNMDTDRMYDNMMNKFKFGGLDKPGIYLDETVMRMCYTHRRAFAQLALRLLQEGKTDKVAKLIDYAEQVISPENVPHNYPSGSLDLARVSLRVKKADHAINLSRAVAQGACEYIEWYLSLPTSILLRDDRDCMYYMYQLHAAAEVLKEANCDEAKTFEERLEGYNRSLQSRLEGMDLGI
ncbi:MAG: DUF2723 domain-containing protein [Bacteroidaceae bacterium]|nr:DUF2723 domain-containing protein [Bacteroidaceae bacterium]MBQ5742510.1 DUF2723 domain-containing protein [Bacteroidaceae bacterium]